MSNLGLTAEVVYDLGDEFAAYDNLPQRARRLLQRQPLNLAALEYLRLADVLEDRGHLSFEADDILCETLEGWAEGAVRP